MAQNNGDFSTENAGKMFSILLATGAVMPPGMQPSFDEIRADPVRWEQVQQGIEEQRDHFDGLALQIGQHYGRRNAPDLRADDFQFCDVGARFPHTWLTIDGEQASSLALLSSSDFTFIVRNDVELPAIDTEVPCQIKRENTDFMADADNLQTMGMDEAAVVLVRPDGHIAARLSGKDVSAESLHDALSSSVAKFLAFD